MKNGRHSDEREVVEAKDILHPSRRTASDEKVFCAESSPRINIPQDD